MTLNSGATFGGGGTIQINNGTYNVTADISGHRFVLRRRVGRRECLVRQNLDPDRNELPGRR